MNTPTKVMWRQPLYPRQQGIEYERMLFIDTYVEQQKLYGEDEWDVRRRAAKYWEHRKT